MSINHVDLFKSGLITRSEALDLIAERTQVATFNRSYSDHIDSFNRYDNELRRCREDYQAVRFMVQP